MTSDPGFEVLPWDSDLFGFPVALFTPTAIAGGALPAALAACARQGVRLAYAFLPWASPARDAATAAGGHLADRRLRFVRDIPPASATTVDGIVPFAGATVPCDLEGLALASGHDSRFRTDPRMPSGIFAELYRTWIRRSVSGEIADAVLVARVDSTIAGMITIALRERVATIGLLAVDERSRGQGLGRKLLRAAEGWALERGRSTLDVVTQGANAGACALYAAGGFTLADEQAVYHFWIDPSGERQA